MHDAGGAAYTCRGVSGSNIWEYEIGEGVPVDYPHGFESDCTWRAVVVSCERVLLEVC
jgi:hypothetical protein